MLEETSIAEVRLIDANEKMEGLAPHVESLEVTLLDIEVRTEVHWDYDFDGCWVIFLILEDNNHESDTAAVQSIQWE